MFGRTVSKMVIHCNSVLRNVDLDLFRIHEVIKMYFPSLIPEKIHTQGMITNHDWLQHKDLFLFRLHYKLIRAVS